MNRSVRSLPQWNEYDASFIITKIKFKCVLTLPGESRQCNCVNRPGDKRYDPLWKTIVVNQAIF